MEIVRIDTGEIINEFNATQLIKDAGFKTQITAKTSTRSIEYWGDKIGIGFDRVAETESPGACYKSTGYAERGSDNIWRRVYKPIIKTQEQILADIESEIQQHLDATAQQIGYDSIYTACTYADEPAVPRFQAEGAALRAWRSAVWASSYAQLEAYTAAAAAASEATPPTTLTPPTAAAVIAQLPTFTAPEV